MLIYLLMALAVAQPAPESAIEDPQLDTPRTRSAERLRRMLGAEPADPLPLQSVTESIDRRHPRFRSAMLDVQRAEGALLQSQGPFDPNLIARTRTLAAGFYGYSFGNAMLEWTPGPFSVYGGWRIGVDTWDRAGIPVYYQDKWTLQGGEARVGLSIPLLEGLVTDPARTQRTIAALDIDRTEAMADAIEIQLRQQAAVAWVGWVASGRMLALERALLDIAQIRQTAIEARITLGDLPQLEELRNLQFLARRRASLENAIGSFEAASQHLSLFLRDDQGARLTAAADRVPKAESPPAAALSRNEDLLVRFALDRHPELEAMRAVIEQRQAAARLARNRLLPDIRVFGEASQDFLGGGDAVPSLEPFNLMIGVQGSMPVLNRSARGMKAATEAQVDGARADLRWAEDQIEARVRQAAARERAALEGWRAATEAVALALRIQEAEQRAFDFGKVDLLRLWQIEQETAAAIHTEVNAWARYETARAELIAAVGGQIPGT
ncbi:MAG: hypothetical protein EA397_12915 [Deltaproteobacteria bacterium]|nr:MAG: hypothetical protein EA397_12915 [Deltaproteobacteria bacterium]